MNCIVVVVVVVGNDQNRLLIKKKKELKACDFYLPQRSVSHRRSMRIVENMVIVRLPGCTAVEPFTVSVGD